MTYNEMIKNIESAYGESAKYIMQDGKVKAILDFVLESENDGRASESTYEIAMYRINDVAHFALTPCNVKEGDGVTIRLWSDCHAATVIKVSKSSITVQRDKAILDPNFKPEYAYGYCTNSLNQTYTYERDPSGTIETFRWSNKCGRFGAENKPFLIKGRHEFYDYNF